MRISRKNIVLSMGSLALLGGLLCLLPTPPTAQAENEADLGKNARCATRLSISLLGSSPSAELLASADPQSMVDALIADPAFVERFASFINSKFNDGAGATSEEDSAYHMSKYILNKKEPWKNIFVAPLNVTASGPANNRVVSVAADPAGLGYFRSQPWLLRYAGNELTGMKLNTAYRMMNNVLGLNLVATTNAPGADVSAAGRASPACRSCHFDNWWALDNAASVLSKVVRNGDAVTFTPSDGTPKAVLGGVMVKDDKEFINAMVESEHFAFNACRLVFNYLYGRPENACESPTFDACVSAFKSTGLMQSAVGSVAKDPNFCQ